MALVRISVRLRGDDEARRRTKALRREIGRDVKEVLVDAVDRRVVPRARRNAPSIVAHTIVARATTSSAYVTSSARGMKRRIFGLLEHGGTVRGAIRPKRGARALRFVVGGRTVFVRHVRTPRKYREKRFVRDAIERERGAVMRDLRRDLPRVMERRLAGVAKVTRV